MKLLEAIANSNAEQKISLLPQALEYGELGIDFLIECLSDRELEVRAKAYELLQGIESGKVRDAIASGLLLNPGDKIYSVYQAGIWFTDDEYCLFDYVYYLEDLRTQVYGTESYEEDRMCESKRIFCYTSREQAEEKAEIIHRDFVQKSGIGIGGFEWEKENPNFNAKQFCLDNNLCYQSEWDNLESYQKVWKIEQLVWESPDKTLLDKFDRSRYIYRSSSINIWCRDNCVTYDDNLDNWENYQNLLDYLYLPKNIELLSKFWKDGVGSFAFVKEEIVRQTAYVKIGEQFTSQSESENTPKTSFFAKPEHYDREGSDYLIKILEDKYQKAAHKLKALELLENFDTKEAKEAIAKGSEQISIESVFDLGEEVEFNKRNFNWDDKPF